MPKPIKVGKNLTIKTMKKSFKTLKLKKEVITNLDVKTVKGGHCGPTDLMCNSVPVEEGGIGCVLW